MKNNFLLNLAFLNLFFGEDGDLGKNGRDTFEFSVQFFFFKSISFTPSVKLTNKLVSYPHH